MNDIDTKTEKEMDIPVEVELLSPTKESLDYLLAVKDSLGKEQFSHYSLAKLWGLQSNVNLAYDKLPSHAKSAVSIIEDYSSICDGLSKLTFSVVKDRIKKKEFGHYTLDQLIHLESKVKQAYETITEHTKSAAMNDYITIWSGLLDLKEKKGLSYIVEAEPPTRKPRR